jgi:hypothetical protein
MLLFVRSENDIAGPRRHAAGRAGVDTPDLGIVSLDISIYGSARLAVAAPEVFEVKPTAIASTES